MRRQQFRIPFRLPSLNEYINACRQNPHVGAAFKRNTDAMIAGCILSQRVKRVDSPCIVAMIFRESGRRRDVDNVESGKKYILDALVGTGALPGDGPNQVLGVPSCVDYSAKLDAVDVYLIEDADAELLRGVIATAVNGIVKG